MLAPARRGEATKQSPRPGVLVPAPWDAAQEDVTTSPHAKARQDEAIKLSRCHQVLAQHPGTHRLATSWNAQPSKPRRSDQRDAASRGTCQNMREGMCHIAPTFLLLVWKHSTNHLRRPHILHVSGNIPQITWRVTYSFHILFLIYIYATFVSRVYSQLSRASHYF